MIYDAEHFFDGWRDDSRLRARVPARGGRRRRRERDPLRHQRLEPAARRSPRRPPRSSPSSASGSRSASTPTTTPSAGSPTRSPRVEAGARLVQGTINGYGERTGNANLVSILPALQLKLGYECVPAERLRLLTETAHFVDELCNLTPTPTSPTSGATPSPTRAACTSPACRRTPAPSSTSSRSWSATAATC